MLEITLLGNGGMMPFSYRYLTAMYARYNGYELLIDCGEGTQMALKDKGLSCKDLGLILITHLHGDHIAGLTGILLLAGNYGKTEPVTILGPKGIKRAIDGLLVIAPGLPFDVNVIEIDELEYTYVWNGINIDCFKVEHSMNCYGYSINIKRAGEFNVEKAKELNVPIKYWNKLQKGDIVKLENNIYTPDMVLGPERKGLKVTYCTDSRPLQRIIDNAANSDLFICEGMYGDDLDIEKAKDKKHMTFGEAATMAKEANVKELWLTHYSPSLVHPENYVNNVCSIFPNTKVYLKGATIDLNYEK